MQPDSEPSKFDLYLKLARLVIGPILVLVVLCVFWKPIKILSLELPKLVEKSKTISVAGITIETDDQITQRPSTKINAALTGLEEEPLEELLEMGDDNPTLSSSFGFDSTRYADVIQRLTDRGLTKVIKSDATDTLEKRIVSVRLTKLGIKSSLVISDLFNAFVQELSKSTIKNDSTDTE